MEEDGKRKIINYDDQGNLKSFNVGLNCSKEDSKALGLLNKLKKCELNLIKTSTKSKQLKIIEEIESVRKSLDELNVEYVLWKTTINIINQN